MPFKLFEFLERFMAGSSLKTLTQFKKNWIKRLIFHFAGKSDVYIQLLKQEIVQVFSCHFHVQIWRVLITSLSADDFQLNSKCIYTLSASKF